MSAYRITGGTLLLPEGERLADLLIKDGVIERILDTDTPTEGYERIDAAGLYVSAGFIDIHQHGGGGADYMDGDADAYLRATEAHLAHGTTSVMPTLLSADTHGLLHAIDGYLAAKADARIRQNLIGIHIEGPYISPYQAGAQKPEHIRSFDPDEYRAIANHARGHIKRWSVAPEIEGAEAFAAFCHARGIALSVAHTNATHEELERAFAQGYTHMTHLFSCMSTIRREGGFRIAGALEGAFLLDGMDVEIIADGCHIPPALLRYVTKFKDISRIALVTDAMRAAGEDTHESFLGSHDDPLPVIVEDGVAKLCDRTAFAGSVATADRLVRTMVSIGTPLIDAVRMMTTYPLRMMGLPLKKGALAEGYDADICLFDHDIRIHRVLVGGKVVL